MNIIYSPAKTMQFTQRLETSKQPSSYYEPFLRELQTYSVKQLIKVFGCSKDIATTVHGSYQGFADAQPNAALCAFTGLAYQAVRPFDYSNEEWQYAEETIRILDAFYGVVTPQTQIKPYRLDFNAKLKRSLTKSWTFTFDEPLINLASKEFSSLVKQPMISVEFLERVSGKDINKATYAKMARGSMLDYCITQQVRTPETLKKFDRLGYRFDALSSTNSRYVFVREKKPIG
jgi:uncharacterized protein